MEKSTLTLKAQVHELQGKTITKGDSTSKIAAPFSSGHFPRWSRRADLTLDLKEGNSDSDLQEVSSEYYKQY